MWITWHPSFLERDTTADISHPLFIKIWNEEKRYPMGSCPEIGGSWLCRWPMPSATWSVNVKEIKVIKVNAKNKEFKNLGSVTTQDARTTADDSVSIYECQIGISVWVWNLESHRRDHPKTTINHKQMKSGKIKIFRNKHKKNALACKWSGRKDAVGRQSLFGTPKENWRPLDSWTRSVIVWKMWKISGECGKFLRFK